MCEGFLLSIIIEKNIEEFSMYLYKNIEIWKLYSFVCSTRINNMM
jgi:hypothetical protein